jgi:hypothetical protein
MTTITTTEAPLETCPGGAFSIARGCANAWRAWTDSGEVARAGPLGERKGTAQQFLSTTVVVYLQAQNAFIHGLS